MSRLMNSRAAARYLGVSREYLDHLRYSGLVSTQQVTLRRAMYSTDDLDAFVLRTTPHRTINVGRETLTIIYDQETP